MHITRSDRDPSRPYHQTSATAASPPFQVHALAGPELASGRLAWEARLIQRARSRNTRANAVQRGFDIVVAGTTLVLSLPVMLCVAAAVRFTSRGPVVFCQTRVGRWGESFECLKFRTMVADAESRLARILVEDAAARSAFEADFKLSDDPRLTRVGRFLRRFSLDELPQLINVLRGDMSIVGPRPVVPEELQRYGDYGQVVLQVRPGMTGPWQVSGRNSISYTERVDLDVEYALNRSLVGDIGIMSRTIRCVLNPAPGESR